MRKPKILVVDDECGFTHPTKQVLSDYEIKEVNYSQLTLETARQFGPDLILLDGTMPKHNGGDLASQFRSDPLLKRTPLVFLTAILSANETGRGFRLVADHPFLAIPVSAEDLVICIEEHLALATRSRSQLGNLSG